MDVKKLFNPEGGVFRFTAKYKIIPHSFKNRELYSSGLCEVSQGCTVGGRSVL